MSSPESLGSIVTNIDQLRQLSAQARRLQTLNTRLDALLPSALVGHVRLANIRDGCLVLHAESAAWASQVRYSAPQILRGLQATMEFAEIRSVRVRNQFSTTTLTRKMDGPRLGSKAAENITAQAASIGDEKLKHALLKLAARGKKPNSSE